jgi:hypothetical protein
VIGTPVWRRRWKIESAANPQSGFDYYPDQRSDAKLGHWISDKQATALREVLLAAFAIAGAADDSDPQSAEGILITALNRWEKVS